MQNMKTSTKTNVKHFYLFKNTNARNFFKIENNENIIRKKKPIRISL